MDADFWHERWQQGRTGFHEPAGNVLLHRHLDALGPPGRVLVPLCGKAFDLRVLAQAGHEVVGAELSMIAAEAFFAEAGETPTRDAHGPFTRLQSGRIAILVGDFFALPPELAGHPTLAYDRAALVALPPETRPRYAAHLRAHLPPGGHLLLITFAYDQSLAPGPPFSVPDDEVRSLFSPHGSLERLSEHEEPTTNARLRDQGVTTLAEIAWRFSP